jgi:hypothetical protein
MGKTRGFGRDIEALVLNIGADSTIVQTIINQESCFLQKTSLYLHEQRLLISHHKIQVLFSSYLQNVPLCDDTKFLPKTK